MIRLLRVELTRLRLRRVVLLVAAAAVVVPGIILVATLWVTRPVTDQDLRAAQEQATEQAAQPYVVRDLARCEKFPRRYGLSGETASTPAARTACEGAVLPQASWFIDRQPLDLTEQRESGAGIAVSVVLTTLALIVGTTFAGHDWNSGSMSNQLLFEPRRLRVWLAKGAAVAGAAGVVSLAVLLLWWTGAVTAAEVQDVAIADHAVAAAYKQALLAAVLAALAALGGYALTMLLRSTVGTLGVLFAVAVAGGLLLAALGLGGAQQVQPQANASAFLVGSYTWTDYSDPRCQGGVEPSCQRRIERGQGLLYLLGALAVVVAPSIVSFRRRDVP